MLTERREELLRKRERRLERLKGMGKEGSGDGEGKGEMGVGPAYSGVLGQ